MVVQRVFKDPKTGSYLANWGTVSRRSWEPAEQGVHCGDQALQGLVGQGGARGGGSQHHQTCSEEGGCGLGGEAEGLVQAVGVESRGRVGELFVLDGKTDRTRRWIQYWWRGSVAPGGPTGFSLGYRGEQRGLPRSGEAWRKNELGGEILPLF